jgi:hypothetical protein
MQTRCQTKSERRLDSDPGDKEKDGDVMQVSVIYAGVPLEVSGDYIPYQRATRLEPAEGDYIEDLTVKVETHDITELITQEDLEAIERLAIGGYK